MTVKLFSFVYSIESKRYGGHIPARSWADAQTLVPFAVVDGELIEEQPVGQLCSVCAGPMKIDLTNPQPIDEWEEVIE